MKSAGILKIGDNFWNQEGSLALLVLPALVDMLHDRLYLHAFFGAGHQVNDSSSAGFRAKQTFGLLQTFFAL